MKVIVIGLDGASFELIDPWLAEGRLPNIARIKKQGVWADMRSVLPPVTSPNWKCYSTGKNPGKVGIFWWENIDWRNRRVYYPTARKLENKEFWDYLSEAGMRVGIVGMPTTYPPKKINGFLISGGPDVGDKDFAYPPELEEELRRQAWRSYPQGVITIDKEKTCLEINEMINRHFEVTGTLARQYAVDFLMVALFDVNTLQHFLWDSPETRAAWETIDKHIGELMAQGCDLMIMSDHGSNKIERVFNINTWLQQEGYLSLKPNLGAVLYKLGINQHTLATLASKLGILGLLKRLAPKGLYRNIPSESGEVEKEFKTGKINWRKSRALASGQGPIYLNPENRDNDKLKKELKRKLEALVEPSTGAAIVEKVYTGEELYHGRYLAEAPDLVMDQAKGVHIPGGIGQGGVFDSPQRWEAENKKFGLFMAYGPNIKRGEKIDNVSILDLAPTILHLMDRPVPDDMDGKVLAEIFRQDSTAAERPVEYQRVGEERTIRSKISGLKKSGRI